MDIDLLSKMVKELILDNDRVVLPGLGCFVAEMVPSTFSDKGYTINPPYRRLYFRSRPDQGDSLTKLYAAGNGIEMEIADKIITDFVAEMKTVLFSKKTVIFPGLGRLRATKENNVFFVADEDLDIYPAGFGLEPISLKTHQESAEEVTATVVGLKQMLTEVSPEVTEDVSETIAPEMPEAEEIPAAPEVVEPMPTEPVPAVHVPEVAVTAEPVPAETTVAAEQKVEQKPRKKHKALWAVLTPVLVAAALFGVFVLISRINPELLDPILYTPEELEILNYKSE